LGLFNSCQGPFKTEQKIRLLILSGRNNHDWETTTPVLHSALAESGRFEVDLTLRPDTLNYNQIDQYDVLISNWNSWPENDLRWPMAMEEGLIRYVEEGGGLLFFHASTSVFYNWSEFQDISTAAWVDQTHHGPNCPVHITIDNRDHPVTKGFSDFYIFDELWIDAGQDDSFQVLGSASKEDSSGIDASKQPAIFVKEVGKGRIFHTILGHDARALRNSGFKALIRRAAEWAATGKVTEAIPQDLRIQAAEKEQAYGWIETDSTFGLVQGEDVIWQFNHNTKHGKPFFHPVCVNQNRMTCLSPDDHIWHLGQWFSWKYINGLNYWEYIGKSYRSEGITDIVLTRFTKHPDFSADIYLEIGYHPPAGVTILKEHRSIHIAAPGKERTCMDYELIFEAVANEVVLDRTPITGEPEGKSWGGYAGLSLRFNQDFMEPTWITATGNNLNVNGSTEDWLYMGFKGLYGESVGSAMFIYNQSRREGEGWYLIHDTEMPFYYFSPAYLYLKPVTLQSGDKIQLNYRILHMSGGASKQRLQLEYQRYLDETAQ